jgi:hypothetical protein
VKLCDLVSVLADLGDRSQQIDLALHRAADDLTLETGRSPLFSQRLRDDGELSPAEAVFSGV